MAGALKTLFGALGASTYLQGVSLAFGEEYVNANDPNLPLPLVVMVPTGGPIEVPGYALNLDPAIEMIWGIKQNVDFYLWGVSLVNGLPSANTIDHADAVETLRGQVLSTLRDQQAQYADVNSVSYGVSWKPTSERWLLNDNAVDRYGRCLVLSTTCELSIPTALPQEATITSVTLNESI